LAHADEVLPTVPSEASEDANTVLVQGTTEQDKQDCDSDEVTKIDTKEQEDTTASTVAKSFKCNEYVILSVYILGRKSCSFLCIKLSFSPAVPQKLVRNPVASLQYIYFCNPILFAICTTAFSKVCKNVYNGM
jgi:hypothetical protein